MVQREWFAVSAFNSKYGIVVVLIVKARRLMFLEENSMQKVNKIAIYSMPVSFERRQKKMLIAMRDRDFLESKVFCCFTNKNIDINPKTVSSGYCKAAM